MAVESEKTRSKHRLRPKMANTRPGDACKEVEKVAFGHCNRNSTSKSASMCICMSRSTISSSRNG